MAATAIIHAAEGLDKRLSVANVESRRKAINDLMTKAMRDGVDYGKIPGTPKPTLYKPGAEKICSMFQIAPRIVITDMSTPDTLRYQVRVELYANGGTIFLGEGIGTASSAETKYQWRAAVCREEFDAMPEDRRRVAYKRSNNEQGFYTIIQVRTECEDQDNTIVKMAKKRALIDAVLTVTAASDIFAQDVEDFATDDDLDTVPATGQGQQPQQGQQRTQQTQSRQQTQQRAQPAQQQQRTQSTQQQRPAGRTISTAQSGRFYAIAAKGGKTDADIKQYLFSTFKIEHSRDLLMADYDDACAWAASTATQQQHVEDPLEPEDDFGTYEGEGRQF